MPADDAQQVQRPALERWHHRRFRRAAQWRRSGAPPLARSACGDRPASGRAGRSRPGGAGRRCRRMSTSAAKATSSSRAWACSAVFMGVVPGAWRSPASGACSTWELAGPVRRPTEASGVLLRHHRGHRRHRRSRRGRRGHDRGWRFSNLDRRAADRGDGQAYGEGHRQPLCNSPQRAWSGGQ